MALNHKNDGGMPSRHWVEYRHRCGTLGSGGAEGTAPTGARKWDVALSYVVGLGQDRIGQTTYLQDAQSVGLHWVSQLMDENDEPREVEGTTLRRRTMRRWQAILAMRPAVRPEVCGS